MGLSIFLLLSESFLNFLLVQKFGAVFESQRKFLLKHLPVLLNFLSVAVFKLAQSLSIFFLRLEEVLIPLLVELLVLLNMSLLTLLSLLCLIENELFVTALVVLVLQFCYSVLSHLSLDVLLLLLASPSMVLKDSNEVLDVVSCWLLIESLFHIVTLHFEFYFNLII
jgi:hypothetical protein